MKIVMLDRNSIGFDIDVDLFAKLGDFTYHNTEDVETSKTLIKDADVVIFNKTKMNEEILAGAPNVKLLCVTATGFDNIDLEYAASKGIPVRNAVGYSTSSVVQSTFMHILSIMGEGPYYDDCVKSGRYSAMDIFTDPEKNWNELEGKTIGIIGMGNIGSRVAKVAGAFGMNVCYYSTSGTGHCKDYPCLSLEELLSKSDIVSIHAPLNERTNGLIGVSQIALMKPEAILVNMGRGGIVDERALADAVDAGTIAGAALDVFVKEPLPADNPLLHVKHPERLRLAPHAAWASVQARERLVRQIADNIEKGW